MKCGCWGLLLATLTASLLFALGYFFVLENEWYFAAVIRLQQACPPWLEEHYPALPELEVARALQPRQRSPLPFTTIIVVVPTPRAWADRRALLRAQFHRSQRLLPPGTSATLLFVLGGAPPLGAQGHPDEHYAPQCLDIDTNGGWDYSTEHSSTTCKVLAGVAAAAERWSFLYLARVGDDAYFRVDAFLRRVAPWHALRGENLALGRWLPAGSTGEKAAVWMGGPPGYELRGHGPYLGGMGYVLSANVTLALAQTQALTGLLDGAPEDLLTGSWLQPMSHARFARVDSPCFHNAATPQPADKAFFASTRSRHWGAAACTPSTLLVHYMTPELWQSIDEDGLLECGNTHLF